MQQTVKPAMAAGDGDGDHGGGGCEEGDGVMMGLAHVFATASVDTLGDAKRVK
jgi:hypothetical protein